ACEAIFLVPGALAVPQQHNLLHGTSGQKALCYFNPTDGPLGGKELPEYQNILIGHFPRGHSPARGRETCFIPG
ncbi:MAG TPA: hypothetical protein VFP70_02800, partial [Burkholderiales bacterium]|nr:hypothetical protein [Burkholderiales bacterium]